MNEFEENNYNSNSVNKGRKNPYRSIQEPSRRNGQDRRNSQDRRGSQDRRISQDRRNSQDRRSEYAEREYGQDRRAGQDRRSENEDRRSSQDRRGSQNDRRGSQNDRRRNSNRRLADRERRERERRKRLLIQLAVKLAPYAIGLLVIILGLIFGIKAIVKAVSSGNDNAEAENQYEETVSQDYAAISVNELELPQKEETKFATPDKYGLFEGYEVTFSSSTKSFDQSKFRSKYGILVDASTGEVLMSLNANDRMIPASMTKIMTLIVAAENLSEEDLDKDINIPEEALTYAWKNDCSAAGFSVDEKVKVRDLLYGTILPSGGDAAYTLALYIAGSHEAFVDMMNEKLAQMGLSDTAHFTNCVGIYNDNHYCTAADMAIILKEAISNELCRQVLSAHKYTTTASTENPDGIELSNWFLRRIEDKEKYGTVIYAKTGYVSKSGNCAASYAEGPDGRTFICVTAGAESSWKCIFDHFETYDIYMAN